MRSLTHLNKYFFKYRKKLLLGILFITLSNIFAIFPAQVIRHAFDIVKETIISYGLLENAPIQGDFYAVVIRMLLFFGALVLVLSIIKGLFMFFMRQTIIVMSRYIEYDLKNEIYAHYQDLSRAFYKRNKTGDLMNRISEDVNRVRLYLGPAIMYTINLIVLFILVIITMLSVNVKLTLYVLLPLPFLSITIYYVSHIINRKSEKVQRQLSEISSFVQEAFSGIRVLKAYNRKNDALHVFSGECEKYKHTALDLVKTNALFQPFMILLIGISTILTIFIGGNLSMAGEVTTGNIAEFVIYVNMLTWPVAAVGWVTSLMQRAAASQQRINEFLQTVPEIQNPVGEETLIRGDISFRNVSFVYPDSGIRALSNISFSVKPGESLAVVGRTGSGKSTIAELLCRMFDVSEGEVLIDGVNIKNLNLGSLRKSIGYVPQDVFLFSDTITNNIAFGESVSNNNRSAIEEAAKNAHIYSSITDLPKGFDTRLGERGVTLSGGQKQRISIARAMVKNPEILIFDDCLSAVDTSTEEHILHNMRKIMKEKTSLIISHRISSVKHCDQILVLDNGFIKESGNHNELLDQRGLYFDLYQKQLLEEEKINL